MILISKAMKKSYELEFSKDGYRKLLNQIKEKNYIFPYKHFRYFEDICAFSEFYSSLVPVTFVLAFYVGAIVARWWTQWTKLPWPDNVAFTVNAYCSGLVRFR